MNLAFAQVKEKCTVLFVSVVLVPQGDCVVYNYHSLPSNRKSTQIVSKAHGSILLFENTRKNIHVKQVLSSRLSRRYLIPDILSPGERRLSLLNTLVAVRRNCHSSHATCNNTHGGTVVELAASSMRHPDSQSLPTVRLRSHLSPRVLRSHAGRQLS